MSKRKYITEDQRLTADAQIKSLQRQINYDTKDYTVELVVQKFKKDEFFIPDYQRGFVWKEKNKSSFIESVLLGLPIPFMFLPTVKMESWRLLTELKGCKLWWLL